LVFMGHPSFACQPITGVFLFPQNPTVSIGWFILLI
jgi:hypothetical protein